MKKILALILSMVIVLTLVSGCGSDKASKDASEDNSTGEITEPITLKLAHVVNEKDGFHIAASKFKELVETKTEGKVNIEIYPNATLGDERTLLEGMQMGTVDMGVITNGPVANFVEDIAVFELPFLFGSPEEAYKILDGPVGKELLDKLEEVNLKGLAYAERGFRNLTNSKNPVNTPSDMEGLKIRVMENPVYIDTFKNLGTNAVPMAWTEALTALQQGTIDGQENPVNVIYSFKLYETQQYLSMTRHTYAPATIIMSLNKFEELPKEVQDIISESAQEAAEYERKINKENEETQIKELKEKGMKVVHPDIDAFKEAVKPVYQQYGEKYGQYIERIQSELNQ
ncbi:TRAP transporter substrate-binding protein [Clostridiisalibacter paucivorans]|uniref:TRAP transporter substrate-binding protein n=1 Tax=Clostridiisalibacter paucivorans TaxID=408753 RepID=UPI00047D2CD6|nr:TRAP transporter substrate-binding protein [Clostridiisalibacter paucivorans]